MTDKGPIEYDPGWTKQGPNIFDPKTMFRIKRALSSGWICGLHQHFEGGRSGDAVAFATVPEFTAYVDAARPGDLFILWSISELRNRHLLLAEGRYRDGGTELIEAASIQNVSSYLAAHRQGMAVALYGSGLLDAVVIDEDFSDRVITMARRASVPGGEMYVLPFDTIDRDDFYLAYAKRPNAAGEVPVGGAY